MTQIKAIVAVLALAIGALFFAGLTPGCAVTTTSPFSGQQVSREQLTLEADRAVRNAESEAEQALAAKAIEAQAKQAEFQSAVARLDATAQLEIADLGTRFNSEIAALTLAGEQIRGNLARTRQDVGAALSVGIGEISRKEEALTAGINLVQNSPAGANPLVGAGLAAVASIFGLSAAQAAARKREEQARLDEQKRAAELKTATDNTWEEATSKAVAQAMQMLLLAQGKGASIAATPPPTTNETTPAAADAA